MLSINKYKLIFSCLLLTLAFLMIGQATLAAAMPPADEAGGISDKTGLNATAIKGYGELPLAGETRPAVIVGKIIGTVLSFLGVVFFGIILYAGIGWITSMGKEEKITEAKEMIIAAVLGLIVVLGAYAITNVVAQIFAPTTGV